MDATHSFYNPELAYNRRVCKEDVCSFLKYQKQVFVQFLRPSCSQPQRVCDVTHYCALS